MLDSIVKVITGKVKIRGATDNTLIGNSGDRLKVQMAPYEPATFSVLVPSVAIANNKSMVSLLNASGSTVTIKLREVKIVNSQTSGVTGVVADFNLLKITGHSGGSSVTPYSHDSSDSLNGSVTALTGSTVSGEGAAIIRRWQWSSDEWGPGPADTESSDHAFQNVLPCHMKQDLNSKPLTLKANEGFSLKQVFNSTAGSFD